MQQADSFWNLRVLRKGDGLVLPSLGCELAVEAMYRKVFEAGVGGRGRPLRADAA